MSCLFIIILSSYHLITGKPITRGMRIAVEHILGMLAAGSTVEELLEGYPFLEKEDIQACLVYAHRMVAHEKIESAMTKRGL
ncbi:MAG: DUF433 domain-containing protein [Nitrospirota bacterium]